MNACIRRWEFVSGETAGCEFVSQPLAPGGIGPALRAALSDPPEGAFLVARLASTDREGVAAAMHAADGLRAKVRLVLAVDLATLARLDSGLPETEGVGLMLDDVSAKTPFGAFTLDSIEAIRFEAPFIAAAARSLRIDSALRAMLFLASDLALGTFAPASPPISVLSDPQPRFDYLSREGRFANPRSATVGSANSEEHPRVLARRN